MALVVETRQGKVEGIPMETLSIFLGLPYAAPWVGFARSGDPGWLAYGPARPVTMVCGEHSEVREAPYETESPRHAVRSRRSAQLVLTTGPFRLPVRATRGPGADRKHPP